MYLGQSHQHPALRGQDLDDQVECRRLSNGRRQEISAVKMVKLQVSMGWCNYGLTLGCLLTKKLFVCLRYQGILTNGRRIITRSQVD